MNDEQTETFASTEGDRYFARNRSHLEDLGSMARGDGVLAAVDRLGWKPKSVLEIGCANGWRLEVLRQAHGSVCTGIDPSSDAVAAGRARFPSLTLLKGTANDLPFETASFDTVIFGFCLYLCDVRDLFGISAAADRVLADRGLLIILDFLPDAPHARPYRHAAGLMSHKMDYTRLFTSNPTYRCLEMVTMDTSGAPLAEDPDDRLMVAALRKDIERAFPFRDLDDSTRQ